ncbi:hypothetical protein HELRODRAFT_162122 [Helobdella robusta]|uniref:UDP-N-acetylglucosamine transferase subunit ALG14 n=1 Tax=Helobdella robusta TaxID=6412 RepID=T1ES93_HELRO|nr:hypothetical protein HELRODRAFT_162122 [Helobdella robusta]ESN98671.1 hypothetical protein HELRODRAFT_162122 [Helobdella robusta]
MPDWNVPTMIVLGSGGHTSEMLKLVSKLPIPYHPRTYVLADTDRLSEAKVHALEELLNESSNHHDQHQINKHQQHKILKMKRSREVHQSWSSTILTTAHALKDSLVIMIEDRPDLLLCNGPGTCVPLCFILFLFRVLCILPRSKIIFIESICRVKSLSLTGKILYHIADQFVVQWPSLTKVYDRVTYLGKIF